MNGKHHGKHMMDMIGKTTTYEADKFSSGYLGPNQINDLAFLKKKHAFKHFNDMAFAGKMILTPTPHAGRLA